MKNSQNNFIEGIGNTPLIKLKAASELTGCNIYGKAEYLNPGGSVKDRAALALIKDAEEKKLISKGIFIIPNTSKTEKEILQFNYELGSHLPFISENGSSIHGLNLINNKLIKIKFEVFVLLQWFSFLWLDHYLNL